MYVLPLVVPAFKGMRPSGCVVYSTEPVVIPATAIDASFISNFDYFVDVIANGPAHKAPSHCECRFCDISSADCPERVERVQIASVA
jgi:hypothetical protein